MATRTGTQLFSKATIADDTIPAQVADQSEINGGWHSVADIAARDATALQYRRWGMVVNVENDANTTNNKQWILSRPSSDITDDDAGALMDNGNWAGLASSGNRFLNAEPNGGWKPGDVWIYTDNGFFFELRKITSVTPDLTFDLFATLSDGRQLYAQVTSGEMAVQTGDTGSFPTMIINLGTGTTRNQTFIFANESLVSSFGPGGSLPTKQFDIFPKIKSESSDPESYSIPEGYYGVYENTETGEMKLWCNQRGALKSITFS